MSQLRLNNLLVLHAMDMKVRTNELNIATCLNDFAEGNEHRLHECVRKVYLRNYN